jgi:hypothetical protein
MPPASAQHRADEEFTSFADELARNPDVEGLLLRLRHGHNPDRHGWCVLSDAPDEDDRVVQRDDLFGV